MSTARSPLAAIREHCIYCSGSVYEVAKCRVTKCPLYEWRAGTNPYREKKHLSDASLEKLRRMAFARRKDVASESGEAKRGENDQA